MTTETTPIAETSNFIVLDKYVNIEKGTSYQTEKELELELIADLKAQGYEYCPELNQPAKLLANLREQLSKLNNIRFSDGEWQRFLTEYLDKPSDDLVEKSRKIHDDYIYDFVFDDGRIQNIYLLDKQQIQRNFLQVIHQVTQKGTHKNRYDVTILVNGLPLVQIELKKRGIAIAEAFNQTHRYSKESFNAERSLFKYLQIFVISNGTNTRYFANTTKREKNSFDFTMNWAKSNNEQINDLKDFTATFLQKHTLLNVLIHYSVFDASNTLLIMRPYQIAATERILWKIKSSFNAKKWSTTQGGGYIWHTTGSGKTLTSFKAARLATELEFIDKVFFVVDRKDLDYQTMREYQRFSPDSVNGSESTAGLKKNLEKDDNKIIVTTIQKLNNLIKSEENLPIYQKQVVFIFDECHRSQFGEAQKNIKRKFKKYYQFGFTGTPIFAGVNSLGDKGTADVFGAELHSYVITDAIRDEKVLKFKVDYNDVRPTFKAIENEQDPQKLNNIDFSKAFLHPNRIEEIAQYILANFARKTHRTSSSMGFNAIFAVSSIEAARSYYDTFKRLQQNSEKPLKIATIFSFAANEEQDAIGEIVDETFDPSAMNESAKEFLAGVINDYNAYFHTNYGVENREFQNYYRDLSQRVKNREIDLLIVVGMFLTGFDAQRLNTLFVDKHLRYHGLIQAYSRTNRIYDKTKTFGNIVTFRNLEKNTVDALTLFGNANTQSVVLERPYREYLYGFTDDNGETHRGYVDVVKALQETYPDPSKISREADKKAFVKLFGEYLRLENILQNYDEFDTLKAFQTLDLSDPVAVENFKADHYIKAEQDITDMVTIPVPTERQIQDYRSTYNDIRDWLRRQNGGESGGNDTPVDWGDVVFEVDLLKSQEINLDYILQLIFEKNKHNPDKTEMAEEIRRVIRSSAENRAKEHLVMDFIHQTDLNRISDKTNIIETFFTFAQTEQRREIQDLIDSEQLNEEALKRYLAASLKNGQAVESGTALNDLLPKMSPLNPQYLSLKHRILQKINDFVEKFKGVGGTL
ncbi:type I restriction endonuclease subunit R [Lonepinella sp. BR2271]|uniref:type I restriction endonuclease subunit R n=1 Tax=Lonepinella sp. BR2271 TaxID=3434550 RepID=UPI003F6DECE9